MWKGVVNETGKVGLFHPSFTSQQDNRLHPPGGVGSTAANKVIYEGIEKFVKVNVSQGGGLRGGSSNPPLPPPLPPPLSNPETPTDSNVNSPTGVLDSSNVGISESAPLISSSSSRYTQ